MRVFLLPYLRKICAACADVFLFAAAKRAYRFSSPGMRRRAPGFLARLIFLPRSFGFLRAANFVPRGTKFLAWRQREFFALPYFLFGEFFARQKRGAELFGKRFFYKPKYGIRS